MGVGKTEEWKSKEWENQLPLDPHTQRERERRITVSIVRGFLYDNQGGIRGM